MDPEKCLEEIRDLANDILQKESDLDFDMADALDLAEKILALDEWMVKGGFLPSPWRINR